MGLAERLMPPECKELWARRIGIHEGLSDRWAWAHSGSQALFSLEDAWVMVLQLPAFTNGWYFGWEGALGTA